MANKKPKVIYLCALRVTRLNQSTLAPSSGSTNGFVSDSGIEVAVTPQYDEGDTKVQRNGCGAVQLYVKEDDRLTGYQLAVKLAGIEPQLFEILTGGPAVNAASGSPPDAVGWSYPVNLGSGASAPPWVGLEGWQQAYINSDQPMGAPGPYVHWIWPAVRFKIDAHAANADPFEMDLVGTGQANDQWPTTGPYADQPRPIGRAGGAMWDTAIPSAGLTYITVP